MTAVKGDLIMVSERDEFLQMQFSEAIQALHKTQENAEYSRVLKDQPKSQIIVLIAAFKVAQKASLFNFEAVHTKYKNYMKSHQTQLMTI